MKNKILLGIVAVAVLGIGLYFYVKSLQDHYYFDSDEGITVVDEVGPVPDRMTLPQNWDDKTREAFWFTSQGSEIMPYDWFTWIEQADNEQLFRESSNMARLGYLPERSSVKNPSGLPIGFTITRARKDKKRGFGMNCAACHTNQIDYEGKKMLIDGAPTLANFVGFYSDIVKSLEATHRDDAKFDRFAKKVLDDNYNLTNAAELRAEVEKVAEAAATRQAVNALPDHLPRDFTSYGRLDAFGNIMNAGTAFALHDVANKNFPTGPVSYPFLWGTHQSDVVQWNASAPNTLVIGPLVRNIGEVVGVFGGLNITAAPWWQQLLGIKVAYSSSVDFRGLGELESWVMDLRSPEWPEKIVGTLDLEKAAKGSILFAEHCQSCHQVIPRDKEGDPYISNKTLVSELGTDPVTAWNAKNYQAKTLILDGIKKSVLAGDPFGVEAAAIEVPVNGVVGLVLKRPVTAIKAGLIPAEHAGIDADKSTLIKLLTQYIETKNKIDKSQSDNVDVKVVPNALGSNAEPLDLDSLVYKGRPLNGIWATAPYLHNGSVPNLWELLQKPEERTTAFWVGSRTFDPKQVGFTTDSGLNYFMVKDTITNEIIPGNSNLGHDYGTLLSDDDKWNLIEYMKSL